jgi:hypothetical protein
MKNALFLLIVSGLLIVRCSKNDETPTPTSAAESKSSYLPLTAGSTWEYDRPEFRKHLTVNPILKGKQRGHLVLA